MSYSTPIVLRQGILGVQISI